MVMADAHEPPRDVDGKHVDMKPIPTNTRFACMEAMEKVMKEEPWFGIEQVQQPPLSVTCRAASCLHHVKFICEPPSAA